MNQSRFADVAPEYYGPNGINFGTLYANFDGVVVRYGVGIHEDTQYRATMAEILKTGFPYQTYFIPARPALVGVSLLEQVERWLSAPGAIDAPGWVDIEPPIRNRYDTMLTAAEFSLLFDYLDSQANYEPWWYSNANCLSRLSWPHRFVGYRNVIAQYPNNPNTQAGYTDYETFLDDYPARKPPTVFGTIYEADNVGWQFTQNGLRPTLGQWAADGTIKRSNDFCVSTIERAAFLEIIKGSGAVTPPPPEPEPEVMQTWEIVQDGLYVRNMPKPLSGSAVIASLGKGTKVTGTGRIDVRPEWPHQTWVEIKFGDGTAWIAAQYYSDGRILAKTV